MALDKIALEQHGLASTSIRSVYLNDILELLVVVEGHGNTALHRSLEEVLIRFLEVSLLHDRTMQRIGGLWASLGVGRGKSAIRERISELAGMEVASVPDTLVDYLGRVLGGSAVQRGRRAVDYSRHFSEVIERQLSGSSTKHIRCSSCGYHFIEADFSRERRILASEVGAVFAPHILPERETDRWKPAFVKREGRDGKEIKDYLTKVTLDHRVPEEGLGWSDPDNLAISCRFCNSGKMSYRRCLEPISMFAAGGLSDLPQDRPMSRLMQTVTAAVFEFFERSCVRCGRSSQEVELTARPDNDLDDIRLRSLAPWNLVSICYECVNDYQ